MATYKTRDGLLEVEVTETDEVQGIHPDARPESQPPDVDYIVLKVRSPNTDRFHLDLEFWPSDAIDMGKDIAKQGKSAEKD
jgi:hypothetical protein